MPETERQVARRLAVGGVDQPQARVIEEKTDRNLGLAQQPLEPCMWGRTPTATVQRTIEIDVRADDRDEGDAGDRVAWRKAVVVLWKGDGECVIQIGTASR